MFRLHRFQGGVKNGENGVYVALTEPLFKSIKDLESMSFYDRQAGEQEKYAPNFVESFFFHGK